MGHPSLSYKLHLFCSETHLGFSLGFTQSPIPIMLCFKVRKETLKLESPLNIFGGGHGAVCCHGVVSTRKKLVSLMGKTQVLLVAFGSCLVIALQLRSPGSPHQGKAACRAVTKHCTGSWCLLCNEGSSAAE